MRRVWVIILTLLIGCASAQEFLIDDSYQKSLDYRAGPGDILTILIWPEKELTQDVSVDSEGYILVPIVGRVKVLGMKKPEMEKFLTQEYRKYIKGAYVRVELKETRSQKIIILGEVTRPGIYYLGRVFEGGKGLSIGENMRILEAIALAGGPKESARLSSVYLVRGNKVVKINVTKIITKGCQENNVYLRPDDIIFVPKHIMANINYALKQLLPSLQTYVLTKERIFTD